MRCRLPQCSSFRPIVIQADFGETPIAPWEQRVGRPLAYPYYAWRLESLRATMLANVACSRTSSFSRRFSVDHRTSWSSSRSRCREMPSAVGDETGALQDPRDHGHGHGRPRGAEHHGNKLLRQRELIATHAIVRE